MLPAPDLPARPCIAIHISAGPATYYVNIQPFQAFKTMLHSRNHLSHHSPPKYYKKPITATSSATELAHLIRWESATIIQHGLEHLRATRLSLLYKRRMGLYNPRILCSTIMFFYFHFPQSPLLDSHFSSNKEYLFNSLATRYNIQQWISFASQTRTLAILQ